MSTQLMTQADVTELVTLDTTEAKKTVAQMTSIMNMIASEKEMSDSQLAMMEKQKWYKKMWFTITGKNKATVKEISQHKDKIAAYTSQAVAVLYENSKVEQMQIVSLGNSVNYLGSQLVATNFALLQTQEATAQFKNDIIESVGSLANALVRTKEDIAQFKSDIISTIGSLANSLNEKIESMDNFHMLKEEIELGKYDLNNNMISLLCIISQVDRRMADDDRKMGILKGTLTKHGMLSDNEIPLTEIMSMFAEISDDYLGIVYGELSCYNENLYADMFMECMERYSLLPKMDKKAKKPDKIIAAILDKHDMDGDTVYSTNELYDCFMESKMDFLGCIRDISIESIETSEIPENIPQTVAEEPSSDSDTLRRQAENGSSEAQYRLGESYYNADEPDYEEAVKWYRLAADKGNAKAQNNLGLCIINGNGVEKSIQEAVKWFRMAAEQGLASGQCSLGICYYRGDGVEKNEQEAVAWFRKAAEQDYAPAQTRLGICYVEGVGVEKDEKEAVKWFQLSAEQGFATGQWVLGNCYMNGWGVEENEQEAVNWYRKAAEQGDSSAQCRLGDCYYNGTGVSKDQREAVEWYRKAAEQEDSEAQKKLGDCYLYGYGVKFNKSEAIKWYRLSAEQDNLEAMKKIGDCYLYGWGVVQDKQEADKWYRKAEENTYHLKNFN